MTDPIELVFCLHQKSLDSPYPMALAAAYISIRQRTHLQLRLNLIIDSTVQDVNLERLNLMLKGSDQLRVLHAASVPEAEQFAKEIRCLYSPAVIWRAWIPEYLKDVKRCLMLDSDLIVLMNVYRIWSLDLNGNSLAAVLRRKPHADRYHQWVQTSPEKYFRVGICLMDLDQIRLNYDFCEQRISYMQSTARLNDEIRETNLLEQSLFNRYFSDSCLPLNLVVPSPDYIRRDIDAQHLKIPDDQAYRSESLGAIVDLKGWLNRSPECLHFWSALLETPWREVAVRQFQLLRQPELLQSKL